MQPDHLSTFEAAIEWAQVRRWKRYNVDVRVQVSYRLDGVVRSANGRGSDMSEGGMALYLPVDLKIGAIIDFELVFPYSQQPVKLAGTVRNRDHFRYGIEYLAPSSADREVIVRSCKALSLIQ